MAAAPAMDWVILRPTLVLSADAYGGTALLRAVAAMPLILPRVLPGARVQTVHVGDVAAAVVAAAKGEVPPGTIADLTEPGDRSFADLVAAVRRWQGWPPPVFSPALPAVFLQALGRIADALGHLGWRSPLRTTALKALEEGIRGDPEVWRALGGRPCRTLDDTLALLPATRQERLFARAWLGLPLAIGTLAMFWTLSGLLALLDPARAMSVLTDNAVPPLPARLLVTGGALADIVLGVGVLWRNWTKPAALGMLGLSGAYLAGSLAVAPELWADPLGPMIKVFPGMALAALVWLMLEER